MAIRLWYFDPVEVEWHEVDFEAAKITDVRLSVGYSHPSCLSWTMRQPQHTIPIPYGTGIVFVDETFGDFSNAVFEGHVAEIQPAGNFEIHYVAYDPTRKAGQEITILSGPVVFPNVYPRLVYNAKIENDDDYAFERAHDRTVGQMIEDLLTDPYALLEAMMAAPSVSVGGPAYVIEDLNKMDMKPQEKICFDTEALRDGLERLLAFYPQFRMVFIPGHAHRKWRFFDVQAAPKFHLYLNDYNSANVVLSFSLTRVLDGRYTACQIDGPPATTYDEVTVEAMTLTELWDETAEDNYLADSDSGTADVSRRWEVADEDKRQLSRLLPKAIYIPGNAVGGGLTQVSTRYPTLLATFDEGTTWTPIPGIQLDPTRGIVTAPAHVQVDDEGASTVRKVRLPDDVKFQFAYFGAPLSARYPTTGFAGSAYDDFNIERLDWRSDDQLIAGWDLDHNAVTASARIAQYKKLAENFHKAAKNTVYAGGAVIAGIRYEFLRLNKRMCFKAKNANGELIETGWEDANAILTDVEYDYSERQTTLQFSSDEMEFLQMDPDQLKQLLQIKAVTADYRGPVLLTWTSNFGFGQSAWVGQNFNSAKYESGDYNADRYAPNPNGPQFTDLDNPDNW